MVLALQVPEELVQTVLTTILKETKASPEALGVVLNMEAAEAAPEAETAPMTLVAEALAVDKQVL
jgi:hypothetical protein